MPYDCERKKELFLLKPTKPIFGDKPNKVILNPNLIYLHTGCLSVFKKDSSVSIRELLSVTNTDISNMSPLQNSTYYKGFHIIVWLSQYVFLLDYNYVGI